MTPAGEARLRAHAATVAAAGHAPAGIAADLADEMLGHLVEAVEDRIPTGTIRIDWILTPTQDGPQTWPRAEVAYAHLDRFVLIGTVGCGETARATDDTVPAPRQSGLLDP